jgi:hypothetical protein
MLIMCSTPRSRSLGVEMPQKQSKYSKNTANFC